MLKRFVRHRPSPALVVASLALFVSLGGVGYAAIKIPANSVGSAQVKNHSLKAIDIANGVIPAAGGGTQILTVLADETGAIRKATGVTNSNLRNRQGDYHVVFNRNIQSCAYVASPASNNAGTPQAAGALGVITAANAIDVIVYDFQGNLVDNGFGLVVFC